MRGVRSLPPCDLVTAGFPCQDLSQCGLTKGIYGRSSSVVREVVRLLESASQRPEWVLFENVPFMLKLHRGKAIAFLTRELERLGYHWAYRTVNSLGFGVPQRRLRVVLLASRAQNPCNVLFADDSRVEHVALAKEAFGFYWTEGLPGLG